MNGLSDPNNEKGAAMHTDELAYDNPWIAVRVVRDPAAGIHGYYYSHEASCGGRKVALLPHRETDHGRQYLLKVEVTPCWSLAPVRSAITGGYEGGNIIDDAARELLEETGYAVTTDQLIPLGESYASKSADTVYSLYGVDLTGHEQGEAFGDGSQLESESESVWVYAPSLADVLDPHVSVMYLRLSAARWRGWLEPNGAVRST